MLKKSDESEEGRRREKRLLARYAGQNRQEYILINYVISAI
jgi:hypothetical protein